MRLSRTRLFMSTILLGLFALCPAAAAHSEITGFGSHGPDGLRRDTEPDKLEKSIRKIIKRIAAATVRVDTADGMGSGTIIDAEGHIITSAHVVEGGRRVTVTLTDGRRFAARVLGINSAGDLALLDIDADNLNTVPVGDSDGLKSHQWVIAAGHPVSAFHDFQPTVSIGLIRQVDATIKADRNKEFHGTIVSDTPLSPGSSGGGLFDLKGRLVAINAAVTRNERGAFSVRINEFTKDKKRFLRGDKFDRVAPNIVVSREERDRTSRTRTQYFTANCTEIQKKLAKRQVSMRRGRTRLSGIIVSSSGDILAPAPLFVNDQPGTLIDVIVDGGKKSGDVARLVAVDQTAGVALLRLPNRKEPYSFFDLSIDVQVDRGQLALAKRRDWMTGGIVGSPHRSPPLEMTDEVYYPHVVQVDLRMFQSDRGAAVVGLSAELLGMVVQPRLQVRKKSGGRYEPAPYGAFLLPVPVLSESFSLMRRGQSRGVRAVGFLGVELQDMTENQKLRYSANSGVRVKRADPGFPAHAAGILRGDIITSIEGLNVNSKGMAVSRISSFKSGDKVSVKVKRRGEQRSFQVTLIDRSEIK
ncbi:MAG: S1-C subfamily serine protease [Planctomycetota bacterium]|jgi:S1-C subfamily serine protease